MKGWKVLTHDYRPPIQGGEPIWDGVPGVMLPRVALDTSDAECAAGWNFTARPETALRIGGLWPTGWPSVLVHVSALGAIKRGDKCRASTLTLERVSTEDELHAAIRALSEPFGEHAETMAREQIAWREALARPLRDPEQVEHGVREALTARGLGWTLRRHDHPWAARDARDALVVRYAALMGWSKREPDLLTRGLREAYHAGLAVALPTAPNTLGWSMVESQ